MGETDRDGATDDAPRRGGRTRVMPQRARASRLWAAPVPLLVGGSVVGVLVVVGVLSVVWTPHPSGAIFPSDRLRPPGSDGFLLGTDRIGRDVLSQIMAGARTSPE